MEVMLGSRSSTAFVPENADCDFSWINMSLQHIFFSTVVSREFCRQIVTYLSKQNLESMEIKCRYSQTKSLNDTSRMPVDIRSLYTFFS